MAVLGVGGRLKLKRLPVKKTVVLDGGYLDTLCDRIKGAPDWLWNGDRVQVQDFPNVCDTTGIPGKVSGFGVYAGSKWYLGPNRNHVLNESDRYYKTGTESYPAGEAEDDAKFYSKNLVGGVPESCSEQDYFVHADQFGFLSFYETRCQAFTGSPMDRVEVANVYGDVTVTAYGSVDYQNAFWECYDGPCSGATSDYWFSDIQDDATDESICEHEPTYDKPVAGTGDYNNADVQPRVGAGFPGWQVIAGIREWNLELAADQVDTSGVGEKFGTAVKSMVNGGGQMEYFIDRECFDVDDDNALALMQLLLMTEKGCEADAEFWMMNEKMNPDLRRNRIGGGLFYAAKLLVTQTAVNVRPTELVAGSARFVTTGDIRLRQTS